jgi:hypothetical protein
MIPLLVGVLVQFLKDPKLVDKETVT